MSATVTPIHARRTRTSEGTASARRLQGLQPWQAPSSQPMALDALDLHRVHHVDTHDLAADEGVSVGGMCTDLRGPHPYSEAHPNSQANKADPAARARFWRWYAISHAAAVACGIGLWLAR
jgi:hypothetical protein